MCEMCALVPVGDNKMKNKTEKNGKHLKKNQINRAENVQPKSDAAAKKKKRRKVVVGFVMLLIIIALLAFLVANHYLDKINRENLDDIIDAEDETFDGEGEGGIDPDDVSWGKVDTINDKNLVNILLIGQDRRPGQGRQRSDSMIICSVNTKTKEISLVSFLRDLYVQLPGDYSDNRLNVPYVFGGFDLLKDTIKLNFGINVDGCVSVDFDGFQEVIDILGGVDIELSAAEANQINLYSYSTGGMKAGMNHLDGGQALAYSQIRKIDSDFNRTERQRKVITAVFNSLKGASLKELNSVANKILPKMTTDMSNSEIIGYIAKCYGALDSEMQTYHVPADDAYYNAMIKGMAVLVPDLPLIRQQLETYLPLTKK